MQCKILFEVYHFNNKNRWLCWVQQVRTDGLAALKSMQSMPKIRWQPFLFVWAWFGWRMLLRLVASCNTRRVGRRPSVSQSIIWIVFVYVSFSIPINLFGIFGWLVIQPSWPAPFHHPLDQCAQDPGPHTAKCQHSLTHGVLWIFAFAFFFICSFSFSLSLFFLKFFLYIDFMLRFQAQTEKHKKPSQWVAFACCIFKYRPRLQGGVASGIGEVGHGPAKQDQQSVNKSILVCTSACQRNFLLVVISASLQPSCLPKSKT